MISINGPNCHFLNSMMENKTLSDNFTANAIAEAHTCVRALISSAAALAAAPPLWRRCLSLVISSFLAMAAAATACAVLV